jgi:restriction system protein
VGCFLVIGLLVALGILSGLIQDTSQHPVAAGFGLFAFVAVSVLLIVLWWRRRIRLHRQQQLYAQQQYEIQVAQSRAIARYHAMTPRAFEEALAFLCHRDGCTTVQVVGGAGDLGADVIASAPDGRKIVLQAKRYGSTTKVVGPDLQKFGGTCFAVHQAQVAVVVTTSVFTKQARQYALHMGIRLFDFQALAGWASQTGPAPWQ